MTDERLAEVRRVPGVRGILLVDSDGSPISGEGPMLAARTTQLALAVAVENLLTEGASDQAHPLAMFARYAHAALFAQTYATGTLAVLCAHDISIVKLRFAATLAVGRLSQERPRPAGISLARAATNGIPLQQRASQAPPLEPTPLQPQPAPAKRKTKLGIWD